MLDAPVKRIVPGFGSKATIGSTIAAQFGAHRQYFEPFALSCAVLFAKQPVAYETINDLHGDAVNLARVLADPKTAVALYDRTLAVLFCESLLPIARAKLEHELDPPPLNREPITEMHVRRAFWFFVASWMMRNGQAGTAEPDYRIAVRFTRGGGSPTVRFRSAIESIPAWHRRLCGVTILRRDGFRLLEHVQDDDETVMYVDPPYVADGKTRTSSASYLHDFTTKAKPLGGLFGGDDDVDDDHDRLAALLGRFRRSRVVLSYYDCPRVRELYAGWNVIEAPRGKNLANANGGESDAPELIIVNGPTL